MQSSPPDNGQSAVSKDLLGLRKRLIELVLMAPVPAVVNLLIMWLLARFTSQPWHGIYFLIPLAVLTWILWQVVKARKQFVLRGPFMAFFVCYVLIFSIAAGSSLLEGKRTTLAGYEHGVSRNFLSLNWLGDWRYALVRKKPAPQNFTLLTMKRAETVEEGRATLRSLIRMSRMTGARGIVLDFYLKRNAAVPQLDASLCEEIAAAKSNNVPVLIGYTFERIGGSIHRVETAPALQPCLPLESHGHLVGVQEWDELVRYVPLHFKGDPALPALSLRMAKLMAGPESKISEPRNALLQFVASENPLTTARFEDLLADPRQRMILRDQFILVGEEGETDRAQTPFGDLPGVKIHAYATLSLLQNCFIERTSWWSGFLAILVFSYLLTALVAQGTGARELLGLLVAISLGALAVAALAMYAWLVWVDVIYFVTAIWLLFFLLAALRKYASVGPPRPTAG